MAGFGCPPRVALRRLRRDAELGKHGLPETKAPIEDAIRSFDRDLSDLATMRNVGEHIDDYVRESGRNRDVDRSGLQVGTFDGTTLQWLDRELNVDHARRTAERLYLAAREAIKAAIRAERVRLRRTGGAVGPDIVG